MPERPGPPPPRRWAEHTVTAEEAGRTVEEVLTGSMGISRRMIQRLTRSKGLQLDRRPAFLGRKVREGQVVAARVADDEHETLTPVEMALDVVHEDGSVLVLDKPPFVLVHPTSPAQTETLAHGVAHHYALRGTRARVRPVHRIDRDTSGLVLFAQTAFAHQHLDRQLRERTLRRTYVALVSGEVEGDEGTIDAPIARRVRQPHLREVREGGEPAVTHWRVAERLRGATLVELELETGRTHQIRVHMQHVGHPVLGDRQYGGAAAGGMRRQALHAGRLSFDHPDTAERITLEAPLPEDMGAAVEALRARE